MGQHARSESRDPLGRLRPGQAMALNLTCRCLALIVAMIVAGPPAPPFALSNASGGAGETKAAGVGWVRVPWAPRPGARGALRASAGARPARRGAASAGRA